MSVSLTIGSNSVSVVLGMAGLLGGMVASTAAGFRLGLQACRIASVAVTVGARRVMHVLVRICAWATLTAEGRCNTSKVSVATTMIGAGHEHVS